MFTSCSEVPTNIADEIRLNKWSLCADNQITLSFNDDIGKLSFVSKNKNNNLLIKGVAFIDSEQIMIVDESDNEKYIFKYKLKDNKLKLIFDNGKIALTKCVWIRITLKNNYFFRSHSISCDLFLWKTVQNTIKVHSNRLII